jgi:hemoglobin-like flavoprotein
MNVWSHPLASMHRGRAAPAPIDLPLIQRLRESFSRIFSEGERFPELCFARLFENSPGLRPLFPEDLTQLQHRFARTLHWLMAHLHEPQMLRLALVDLGRRHQGYSVRPEDYPPVCDAIVEAMSMIAGDDWNEEVARDWRQTFELMSLHMLRAYRSDR